MTRASGLDWAWEGAQCGPEGCACSPLPKSRSASGQLPAPWASLAAPICLWAGRESAQPRMPLWPVPTCLLSLDETTNPSQSRAPQRTGGEAGVGGPHNRCAGLAGGTR